MRTNSLKHAIIGARGHHIVLNKDGFALHGAYHGRGLVAVGKAIARLSHYFLIHLLAQKGIGVHGCEIV